VFFILALLKRKAVAPPVEPAMGSERAMSSGQAVSSAQGSAGEARADLQAVDRAMHRYAEGDDRAFGEVFAALAPRLRLFLCRLGCSVHGAEDLMQETFLRMHHARGSFARGRPVAPWAYAIARNCFVSHARSGKAKLARASVDADRVELPAGTGADVEQESMARQAAAVVSRTLAAMTPARREAFVLLRYEGLSVAAAAQVVGISEGALKIRAFHAYEALRAALAGMEKAAPSSEAAGNPVAMQT
jgi:RNA polymerase sigma-70 factor, ECF subfamily